MAKAATLTELQDLHRLIAKSLNKRIAQDMDDDLAQLRAKLTEQSNARKLKTKNVLALVQEDMAREA